MADLKWDCGFSLPNLDQVWSVGLEVLFFIVPSHTKKEKNTTSVIWIICLLNQCNDVSFNVNSKYARRHGLIKYSQLHLIKTVIFFARAAYGINCWKTFHLKQIRIHIPLEFLISSPGGEVVVIFWALGRRLRTLVVNSPSRSYSLPR